MKKHRSFPVLPPEKLDRELMKLFSQMDVYAETFRRSPLLSWPDWCFLPMAASYAIVSDGNNDNPDVALILGGGVGMMGKMAATIAWKYTKAVYAFDNELTQMLIGQSHEDAVPVESLLHLPVPCVYIAYPPMVKDCVGLYAFWEYDNRYRIPELRLHYLMEDGGMIQIYLQFPNKDSTIQEAVALAFNEQSIGDAEQLRRSIIMTALMPDAQYWNLDTTENSLYDILWAHINMLLYLCSDKPDVTAVQSTHTSENSAKPKYPKRAASYDVGTRIGAAIRRAKEASEKEYESEASMGHASPRPHVRRAHWHSFWTGKLDGERRLIVKWLPPVFVCVGKEFKVDTTIYPVKV